MNIVAQEASEESRGGTRSREHPSTDGDAIEMPCTPVAAFDAPPIFLLGGWGDAQHLCPELDLRQQTEMVGILMHVEGHIFVGRHLLRKVAKWEIAEFRQSLRRVNAQVVVDEITPVVVVLNPNAADERPFLEKRDFEAGAQQRLGRDQASRPRPDDRKALLSHRPCNRFVGSIGTGWPTAGKPTRQFADRD